MASKRVLKSTVDWISLAKRIPDHEKPGFFAFKSKSDGFLRKVMANPEEPPKIDWSYYKTNAANKALVEQFEKAYTAMKIQYPDDKGTVKKIEEEERQLVEDIVIFKKNSNERIKKYEAELEAFAKALPIEEMSEEEFALAYPQLSPDYLNKPTTFPHIPDCQDTPEDIEFWRARGVYYKGPDKYHPRYDVKVQVE